MKNKIWLLALLVICATGCTNINNLSYEEIARESLGVKSSANISSNGYSLFLPQGMTLVLDNSDNLTIYSEGKKYYLYVDLVSYYNKSENEYMTSADSTYNEEFIISNKKVIITTKNIDQKNHLMVYYNYAKIEVVTDDIKKDIAKSLIILNNIDYNDVIIKSLVGDSSFSYNEEQFNLAAPDEETKNSSGTQFLKYEEDYGDYVDKSLKDEDKIDIQD